NCRCTLPMWRTTSRAVRDWIARRGCAAILFIFPIARCRCCRRSFPMGFVRGVIRSVERMTYTNVNKVIEGDPEMSTRYAPLVSEFQRMKELALLLNKRRRARGSIDFDLPEAVIEFDAEGRM